MNSNKKVINAYKGLFTTLLLDLRRTIIIGLMIIASLALFNFVLTIVFISFDEQISNDGVGSIFMGGIVMLIAFVIHIIISTSGEELHGKFTFPIDRSVYAVTNFVFIICGSFVLLAVVTIVAPVEMLLYYLVEVTSHKIIFINQITLKSYLMGFAATWAYLIFFGSITYGIFMYIRKYPLYSLPVIAIIFTTVLGFGWLGNIVAFLFLEDSLGVLVIKLLSIAVIANGLGYIPLKRLEVQ